MTWPPKVNEEKERVRRTSIIAVGAVVMLLGLLDVAFTQEALTPTRDPAAGARLFASDIETWRQNRAWPQLTGAEMVDIAAFLAHR